MVAPLLSYQMVPKKLTIEWGDPKPWRIMAPKPSSHRARARRGARRWRKAPEALSGWRSPSKRERQPGGPRGARLLGARVRNWRTNICRLPSTQMDTKWLEAGADSFLTQTQVTPLIPFTEWPQTQSITSLTPSTFANYRKFLMPPQHLSPGSFSSNEPKRWTASRSKAQERDGTQVDGWSGPWGLPQLTHRPGASVFKQVVAGHLVGAGLRRSTGWSGSCPTTALASRNALRGTSLADHGEVQTEQERVKEPVPCTKWPEQIRRVKKVLLIT